MSADQSANLETGKLYSADFNKLSEEEQVRVRSTESFLDALEANINTDLVTVPVFDMYGNITNETKLMSMSQALQGVVRTMPSDNPLQSESPTSDGIHSEALRNFEEAKKGLTDKHEVAHAVPVIPRDSHDHWGLPFLTDPPSAPSQTVKLQLSGPVKFGTTMNCHAFVITEHVVVLVTDLRVKGEIIDLSLEDSLVEASLVFDEQTRIEIYPPIPALLTYDIGVLRHFIFIRKNG